MCPNGYPTRSDRDFHTHLKMHQGLGDTLMNLLADATIPTLPD